MTDLSDVTGHSLPVSVVLERREKRRDRWSFVEWKAVGVLRAAGPATPRLTRTRIHHDRECERFRWSTLNIELILDEAEHYWNNLMASEPSLFVVCRKDDDSDELEPFLVTANYDDIIGYLEVEDEVFSLPIPPDIHNWIERYVVNNYIPPRERKKRKRKNWSEDGNEPAAARRAN